VFIQDSSGHHGVINSVLMKQLKIDENSKNPEGEQLDCCARAQLGPDIYNPDFAHQN
jgi:predicted amidohydrolase YtcJ